MRIICSDDDNGDIMTLSAALQRAQDIDLSFNDDQESPMTAKQKKSAAAEETTNKKTKAKAEPEAKGKGKAKDAAPAEKEKGTFGPRAVPDGHTGIAALATEFETTPALIRRKLRSSELTKPADGWHWKDGSKDLAAVRKLLTPAAE